MKNKLPNSWIETNLGDKEYFEILPSGINKFSGEKEYLSTESIKKTKIEKVECKISYKNRPSRANMQPGLNSVWFAKMKSTLKVYSFDEKNKEEVERYILSTGFAGIKINEQLVDIRYLRAYLLTPNFNSIKDSYCSGATQKAIGNEKIAKIKILLPPLEIQKQIVAILERAERLRDKRKRANELSAQYLKSVFYEMFGDPALNQKEWNLIETQELFDMKLGKMLSATNYTGKHLKPYLRNINVQWGYLDLRDIKEMDFDEKDFVRYNLKKGDILVCEGGEVGRTAIYNDEIKNCCYQNALHRLRIKDKRINSLYFIFYMWFAAKYGLIIRDTIQVTIAHFTQDKFKKFKIMVPPIELQNKFSSMVEQFEKLKDKQKQSEEKINNLYNSTMQRAFTGDLIK